MRLLLALCLAVASRAAALPRAAGSAGRRSRSSRPRTSGAASPRSSAGNRAQVRSIIVNPGDRPAQLRADAVRRAHDRRREDRDRQRDRLRHLGLPAPRGRRRRPRDRLDVGDVLGLEDGDNPHQWYSPAAVRKVVAAITAAYVQRRSGRRPLLRGAEAPASRRRRSRATTRCAPRSAAASPASPSATARASSSRSARASACGSSRPPASRRRSPRAARSAPATRRRSSASSSATRSRSGSSTARTSRPRSSRLNALARAEHIPVATVTETLSPATLDFEQWQVAELEAPDRALHRATGR